jgi:O-antigen/teichoic acid export membrane protein
VQLLSAVSTAILARVLGVADFGGLSAGLALYYLLSSGGDFGFGLVLARELGGGKPNDGVIVRSMLRVQASWSLVIGLIAIAVALVTGLDTVRADVLIAFAPTLALMGLGGVRQVFYATYATGRLGLIDLACNGVQVVAVSTVAILTKSAVDVGIVTSVMAALDTLAVLWAGLRLLDRGRANASACRKLFRMSLPLGLGSLLASAYFTIDLTIVAYLVSGKEVGYYAAATKALSVLVTLPGLVMSAALAGLSKTASDRQSLGDLAARIWHWLAVIALPLCIGVIIFARGFVDIFFGSRYGPSVELTQILAGSAVVALLSNVFGNAMVATRRTRWLITQGFIALIFNVAGNLLLLPHWGVLASAWLTLVTELLVCFGSYLGIRRHAELEPLLRVTLVPAVAVVGLALVGLPLSAHVFIGVPAAALSFFIVLLALHGWPEDLPRLKLRRVRLFRR